tara:strand:+ start:96 stop:359 length:264 start_codon:yes stop_codon:yes gene_type:complete
MPSEDNFFPQSHSKNASVNAKIVIKNKPERKPKIVKGEPVDLRGVYHSNENRILSSSKQQKVVAAPEPTIVAKAFSFFTTFPKKFFS